MTASGHCLHGGSKLSARCGESVPYGEWLPLAFLPWRFRRCICIVTELMLHAESFCYMSKCKNWCFTAFKYERLREIIGEEVPEGVSYIVGQVESCPETGRLHVQGFVQFVKRRSMRQVKQFFGDDNPRLKAIDGTAEENRTYCTKEETRIADSEGGWSFELGTLISKGERRDLADMGSAALLGESLLSIAESNTASFIRYHGGISRIRQLGQRRRTREFRRVKVFVLWGDSGSGKSALARLYDEELFSLSCSGDHRLVFDGYEGEKTLLIDDFYGNIKYQFLLNLLDGHQIQLPCRYANAYAEYDTVILTSNVPPDEWYQGLFPSGMSVALKRRVTEVFLMECQYDGARMSEDDMNDILNKMRN